MHPSFAACARCDRSFPIQNGVLDVRLTKDGYYDSPLKQSDMQRINEQFSRLPWNDSLGQFLQLSGDVPLWLDKIVDEGRYAWKIFLGLRPGTRLLDYGCNLGTSTKNLAPHFAQTYALEQTFENAVFTRKRLDRSNPDDDITVAVCEYSQQLPLQDACIDVAVATDVLELADEGNPSESESGGTLQRLWQGLRSLYVRRKPRLQQLALLREFNRVLAPDGEMFIRCGNRLDYRQFTDSSDKTTQVLTSILPRSLADLLPLPTDRQLQPRYLHTLWGYRRLLKQAGFSSIQFIAFFEDDNLSEELRPGPGKFPLWSPLPYTGWKQYLKHSPYLAQNFGIIARKGNDTHPRLEDMIAEQISRKLGLEPARFRTQHYLVSRKGKLIFRAACAEQELFVRLPLTLHAAAAELHNHSTLEWLHTNKPALSGLFPRPVLQGNIQQQIFFAETAVPGAPLVDLLKQQGEPVQCLRTGLEFLIGLNDSSTKAAPPLSGSAYERLVLDPLHNMSSLVTPDKLNQLQAFFSQRLENKRLPRGLMHGDYGARNILLEGDAVSGLLDWEESDKDGLPAIDAICLVFSCYSRLGDGFKGGLSLVEMARRVDYFKDYLPALDEYYRRTDVDEECHEGLVLLYWVQVISHRVSLGRTIGNTSSELMVQRIVNRILDAPAV